MTTYLDTTFMTHAATKPLTKKKDAKKELLENEFSFEGGVEIGELSIREWIDNVFEYLYKRYKKGKKKGNYSISSGDTLVSGTFTRDGIDGPEIEIIVSKGYTKYNCYLN